VIADCRLATADCGWSIADCLLRIVYDRALPIETSVLEQSAIENNPQIRTNLQSAMNNPQSAIRNGPAAIGSRQSPICND
jgi:hypothetical protein